jgi:apolipoprotein N-acyltransferase
VPVFIAVVRAEKKDIFYISFIAGFWGNLLVYNWIRHLGASVDGGPVVVLLFLVPFLTFFFAVKVWFAESLSRLYPSLRLFIFPAVWLVIDFIQSIGHLAFPWPYMGYSQYPFKPVVQLAAITGVSGVTFLIVIVNTALAQFVSKGGLLSLESHY